MKLLNLAVVGTIMLFCLGCNDSSQNADRNEEVRLQRLGKVLESCIRNLDTDFSIWRHTTVFYPRTMGDTPDSIPVIGFQDFLKDKNEVAVLDADSVLVLMRKSIPATSIELVKILEDPATSSTKKLDLIRVFFKEELKRTGVFKVTYNPWDGEMFKIHLGESLGYIYCPDISALRSQFYIEQLADESKMIKIHDCFYYPHN